MDDTLSLLRLRNRIAGMQLKAAFLRLRLCAKAGFNPDQPRDERGRWVLIGGRWVQIDGRWTSAGRRSAVVVRRDRTGNKRIDATSDHLLDIATETIDEVGPGLGKAYGILVHKLFADKVRQIDLPGIGKDGVEQSFSLGDTVRYGFDGSIRTDVIMREGRTKSAPVLSVWDLKTGSARLRPARVREMRENLGIGPDIPIMQIHVKIGISAKRLSLIFTVCVA